MTTNKERSWRALAIRFGIVKERNADLAGEDVSHVFGEDDEVGLTRSSRVVLIIGPVGLGAMTKIMGFLIMCIGVQFVVNGILGVATDPELLRGIKATLAH